jgi:hypothetical protein
MRPVRGKHQARENQQVFGPLLGTQGEKQGGRGDCVSGEGGQARQRLQAETIMARAQAVRVGDTHGP